MGGRGLLGLFLDWRVWLLLLPAAAVLSFDFPVLLTLLYSLAALFIVAAVAHVIRQVLFPYIDLERLVREAEQSPLGAALVFLAVSIILAVTMLSCAIWIAK